jgi:exosortase
VSTELIMITRTLVYAMFVVLVALLNLPVVRGVIELSRRDPSASHLVLIPLVTLALVYRDRARIFRSLGCDLKGGAAAFAVGGLLLAYARVNGAGAALLQQAACGMVLWALGGFLVCYGRQPFRGALFPLTFLVFAIPIPPVVLDSATAVLKRSSAEAVAVLFSVSGTAFHREGYVFTLRDFVIEVADECSGIRSSIALLLTILLAGHMFLRTSWKKALLVVAIFPLTILKNGIRIVALSLLAMHVDPGFLTGQLHHEGGIVFFLLALLLLFPLFAALVRSDSGSPPCVSAEDVTPEPTQVVTL